jgi:hypothetical protein
VSPRRDEGAPSITRSTLLVAGGEALDKRRHEYVPDQSDLTCARCELPRRNWRHSRELRAAVVVLNPSSIVDRLPRECVSVQFEIPLPRPGSQ